LHGEDTLEKSIQQIGFNVDDVTDVFLTHLHFDHCGGGVKYNSARTKLELAFPRATYWSNESHWKWATEPNSREKASFLKENIIPIQESGQLKFVNSPLEQLGFELEIVDGHTEKQMLPIIPYKGKKIIFMADLIPSLAHLPIPYVMGYDVRPLLSLQEKERVLKKAADEGWILFFEHDAINECCNLQYTEKGIRSNDIFKLNHF